MAAVGLGSTSALFGAADEMRGGKKQRETFAGKKSEQIDPILRGECFPYLALL